MFGAMLVKVGPELRVGERKCSRKAASGMRLSAVNCWRFADWDKTYSNRTANALMTRRRFVSGMFSP
jgi:hypothetical protein